MFNQLRLANVFANIKGLIFGRFVDCYDTDSNKRTFTLNVVIVDYFEKLKTTLCQFLIVKSLSPNTEYYLAHGGLTVNLMLPEGLSSLLEACVV